MKWTCRLVGVLASSLSLSLAFAYPAHYFVVKEAADGTLAVVSHELVDLSGAPESTTLDATPTRLESHMAVHVREKASRKTVFTKIAVASPWLRGEFHAGDKIDGHTLQQEERLYVVRVPMGAGTVLNLNALSGPAEQLLHAGQPSRAAGIQAGGLEIDLDEYASFAATAAPPPPPAGAATGSFYQNGSPANRLDLLIVAEGYTAAQQAQFIQQATALVDNFLLVSPYSDFRHLINVKWLFVPSNQSGADKPACLDAPGEPVVTVDTAFDAKFCTSGIKRLVTVSQAKVFAAAAGVPDWDLILVLVNDNEYGGSGGNISVATTNASSVQIMQHEFGHAFTKLADEYDTPFPGYPSCSDLTGSSPCEANVTNQTVRANIKWLGWINPATAIPTVSQLADPLGAGLWEGARYLSTGMYRQCNNGMMRSLGVPFCHVDTEAFVKRLYGGGWGAPAQGVSLIEPGSVPSATTVNAIVMTDSLFQATLAGSQAASGLTASWVVDNSVITSRTAAHGALESFTYWVPDTGTPHTVELRVTDNTSLMLMKPSRSKAWTVTGTPDSLPGAPTNVVISVFPGRATISFASSAGAGSPITSFTVTCTAPGRTTVTATGASSPITVQGLAGGVSYSCSVKATNNAGPGTSSTAVQFTSALNPATAPLLMLLLD